LILTIATVPLVFAFAKSIRVDLDKLAVIAFGIVFWGWIVSLSDMAIYMLYEGRRFWPKPVRSWGIQCEKRRLAAIHKSLDEAREKDRNLYLESAAQLRDFPIDSETEEPEVHFPSRLGNLIAAYETHSYIADGIDAVFYWPRLWVMLDKDLREEMDGQQAIVDSAVYTSFALWMAAILLCTYAGANEFFRSRLGNVPPPWESLLLAAGCGVAAWVIYRLSLFAHSQFGELFKALFDQHHEKLVIDDVVKIIGNLVGDKDAAPPPKREQYAMVARYLRYHRIRPPGEPRNYLPKEWQSELKERESALGRLQFRPRIGL
jgi:hypothetical protein